MVARGIVSLGLTAWCLAPVCGARAATDPTPKGWLTYVNTKYDFDICYPPALHAQPPAAAGDGQTFTGSGGGTLTAFWRPGSAGDSLVKTADGEVAGMGASPKVTYTAGRGGWAVRSGRQGGNLFYIKIVQRDSDYLLMEATYPATSAKLWNGLVAHFAACFESSRPK